METPAGAYVFAAGSRTRGGRVQTMRRTLTGVVFCLVGVVLLNADQGATRPAGAAAPSAAMLTVDSIMRGPKLVGSAPTNVRWSMDSSKIYFSWQKAADDHAAQYVVNRDGTGLAPFTGTPEAPASGRFDRARRRVLVAGSGGVAVVDVPTGLRHVITHTSAIESNPRWARHDTAVTFMRDGNLFLVPLAPGDGPAVAQLTDVVPPADATTTAADGQRAGVGGRGGRGGQASQSAQGSQATTAELTDSQRLLQEENQKLIQYLQQQQQNGQRGGGRGGRGGAGDGTGASSAPIARLQLGARQSVVDLELSGDEHTVWALVNERSEGTARNQDVPNYITRSAYPEMITGRTDVGDARGRTRLAAIDVAGNKVVWADASAFAGVERKIKPGDPDASRVLDWSMPDSSDDASQAVVSIRSQDHKDRWFAVVDPATGKPTILDHLHDDAWIRTQNFAGTSGGAGGTGIVWLPDNKRFLFLSETDGYMHVYSLDVTAASPQAKALTSGKWEVTDARLSADRRSIFLTTNEVHPGERHFYTMSVDSGPRTKITTMTGSNEATVSPDEKSVALIYSYSTKPPELYVMPFTAGATAKQVTTSPTPEFLTFKWIDPKVITYKTRDGQDVYARLMTPEMIGAKRDPHHPAVIFIHGAGYLQEAHKYWSSSYYRENMFNNILASRGYVVLDPDYRASAGYGRDWRTAIYEHMGGKDLDDVVDGAKFLVATEKVDPKRIGTYGGSYGGFLTLMAMFTAPDTFAAGAALRPVTDWSHYNDGYTSEILNTPQTDPQAYTRSSPIYFAEGLKGRLLICHGMVDTNVFFQDSVRLVQRLIELGKVNWEFAPFPVENHTFTEETSWASEYKRILNLFEETLRK
jgi:dipeptidyl aminopeptidase/acylaminoacyl peptidase